MALLPCTHRSPTPAVILATALALPVSAAPPPAVESTLADQRAVAVTVYNDGLGLVREVRDLTLPSTTFSLVWRDVASRILPQSVSLVDETNMGAVEVLEQNYQYDLVDHHKLLQKYLGKRVRIRMFDDAAGREVIKDALLLAPNVVQVDERIYPDLPGQLILPELPGGLISVPTLEWQLLVKSTPEHRLALSYLTGGMSWQADYVAVVNAEDTALDLNGWTTIRNNSGATYTNAALKLVAGEVNRVTPSHPAANQVLRKGWTIGDGAGGGFVEKSFFEYHLYTLGRTATLRNNEQKQIALLDAAGVPASKQFLVDVPQYFGDSETKLNVQTKLNFENSEANHLGMPLPKGIVRVYKRDSDGTLQFVGEDRIEHTPKDEPVRLFLGNAFDVTAAATVLSRKQLSRGSQVHYEVRLRNHKTSPVTVLVRGHAANEWEIKNATHGHSKRDATTFEFSIPVPAEGEATLRYLIEEHY